MNTAQPTTNQDELLTYKEVAARLKVCVCTAKNWGRAKKFPVIKSGYRTHRVRASALEAFLKRRERIAVNGR